MNKKKRNVIISIMLATFLAAFEGTVVTTAMPTIANNLAGYDLISWIFSAYLLTSSISTPIYGKLSDMYGRKKILSIGIIIFLIGSSLCGLSQNMTQLILYRGVQGLGAGSILTVTFTIVGDLFDLSERAKIQGGLSTVWGIASLIGPVLGGIILSQFSWHWIFFINIPFGLIAIYMLNKNLDEEIVKVSSKIDYLGSIFLTIFIVSLLFGSLSNNKLYFYLSIIIALISIIIFYFIEKYSKSPLLPFNIFTKTTIIANFICFIIAALLTAIESYTPLYTQNVLNYNATLSGIFMSPMSFTWLLSSFILSKALPKFGEKKVIQGSLILLLISTVSLKFLTITSPIIFLIISVTIMGFGLGGIFTSSTIIVQSAVATNERGISTSTNTLIRTIGQTLGVSVFGGILNSGIIKYFEYIHITGVTPKNIVSSKETFNISGFQIQESFYNGIHDIFTTLIFLVTICLILSLIIPQKSQLNLNNTIN